MYLSGPHQRYFIILYMYRDPKTIMRSVYIMPESYPIKIWPPGKVHFTYLPTYTYYIITIYVGKACISIIHVPTRLFIDRIRLPRSLQYYDRINLSAAATNQVTTNKPITGCNIIIIITITTIYWVIIYCVIEVDDAAAVCIVGQPTIYIMLWS